MDGKQFIGQVEAAWRAGERAPDGRRLTRLHVHIAAKLAFWRAPVCRQRSLARAARCSVRTVQRALVRLSALGLLSWHRQVLATPTWRAQIANAYALGSKEEKGFRVLRSSANVSPPGARVAAAPLPAAVRAAQETLAAIRARRAGAISGLGRSSPAG